MKKIKKPILYLLLTLIISFLLIDLSKVVIKESANNRGMRYLKLKDQYNYEEMFKLNGMTPLEEDLPKNLNNTLIYVYQYGCEDCYKNNKEIHKILKDENIEVFNVPYRSKQIKRYKIEEVPSLIYISPTNDVTINPLVKKENDEIILDKETLTSMINLYKIENKEK